MGESIATSSKFRLETTVPFGKHVVVDGEVTKHEFGNAGSGLINGSQVLQVEYINPCNEGETSVVVDTVTVNGATYGYNPSSTSFPTKITLLNLWPSNGFKMFNKYDVSPGFATCLPMAALDAVPDGK